MIGLAEEQHQAHRNLHLLTQLKGMQGDSEIGMLGTDQMSAFVSAFQRGLLLLQPRICTLCLHKNAWIDAVTSERLCRSLPTDWPVPGVAK